MQNLIERAAQIGLFFGGAFVSLCANQQSEHPLGWFILTGLMWAIAAAIQDCIEKDRKNEHYRGRN